MYQLSSKCTKPAIKTKHMENKTSQTIHISFIRFFNAISSLKLITRLVMAIAVLANISHLIYATIIVYI